MPHIWAGIDIGKTHHHCVVIDDQGQRLFSRRVANDETELLDLLAHVLAVHRASAIYRGEGKTDALDAFVIADQARDHRGPAHPHHPPH